MPTFTVIRDGSVIEDSVFDVDPVVDTSNPFGDFAVVKMDDRGGEKFDAYNRGTRVEISVDPEDATLTIDSGGTITTDSGDTDNYNTVNNGGTYSNQGTVTAGTGTSQQFTGYCVEPRETEQSGADVLEVEAYSFDQFLRRNTVTNDQTGNLISEALQDIIETDTPVSYNAAKIDVGDDRELTRSYRGEPVEAVFRDLAFKSNNEEFGVDGDLDAFFRPRETEHIDRGIDDTQWFNYDIPELGKEAVNEVEVWFDDGDESVIVDDGTDKLDLQDSLDLPEPGTQRAELNRPLITEITDAEDIGRKYLSFRNATLSGTVTTFGLFDSDPGDTIDVTIEPRGIDEEFVIAATEYRWGRDETILTIVENRGEVDDILSEINDSVQRQEMQGADRDAPKNRITTTNATAVVSVDAEVQVPDTDVVTINTGETLSVAVGETNTATTVENAGTLSNAGTFETTAVTTTIDSDRFVNPGRRAVRDTWVREANPPDITTLVVGDDNSGLSRSNTALRDQMASATVTQSLPDSTTVEFTASLTETGIEEIGLEAADGTLITRATFDGPVDLDGDVTVTLSVSNDGSVSRGVLTATGQTEVRNILADNQTVGPVEYAYGSDGSPVAESDTSLGNELVSQDLDLALVEYADSQTEWEGVIDESSLPDTVKLENGALQRRQSGFIAEAEDNRLLDETITSNNASSDGEALELLDDQQTDGVVADTIRFEFTNEYEIVDPAFYLRWRCNGTPPVIRGTIDGTEADAVWDSVDIDYLWEAKATSLTLDPGTHTVEVFVSDDSPATDPAEIDLVYLYDDNELSPTFDDEVNSPGGYLDGPELYSNLAEVAFEPTRTQRELTSATAFQTWNDTTNAQFIELSNDGGSTFQRTDNNDVATGLFANPSNEVIVRVGMSRFGQSGATPLQGANGQEVSVHELRADVRAITSDGINETVTRAVIPPNTINGETVREAGLKFDGDLLTRHVLAEFELLADQRLASSESTRFAGDN